VLVERIAATLPRFNRFSLSSTARDATETGKSRQIWQNNVKKMSPVRQFVFLNERLKGILKRNRAMGLPAAGSFSSTEALQEHGETK